MNNSEQVSATIPDWSRERVHQGDWEPGRELMRSIRGYQAARVRGGFTSLIISRLWVLAHRFWSAVAGADIPINTEIGGGLALPHPNGIVIHVNSKIGPNCLIFQQVTLGGNEQGAPTLIGHVDVGAGAKILGKITIGAHAKIGANSVVLIDVPEGATAVGIPAKLLPKK
jgi:serine O-acetyltransferase